MSAIVLLLDDTIHPTTVHELRDFCLRQIRGVRGAVLVPGDALVDIHAERMKWEAALAKIASRMEGELELDRAARLAGAL